MPQSHPDSPETNSLGQAVAVALLFMGALGGVFGVAGLLGIVENLELKFFSIELNSQRGRIYWVIGCLVSMGLGLVILKLKKNSPIHRRD